MFAVGSAGNLYHHHLLASLRKGGDTGYKVPMGGLFELVAAPHYLFELVAWARHVTICSLRGARASNSESRQTLARAGRAL